MRSIKYIVIHCTATKQSVTVGSIQAYWSNVLRWKAPGYHYIIEPSGNIAQLLEETLIANGVKGYNAECIHISYIGGLDAANQPIDNRTCCQKTAMLTKIKELMAKYPGAIVQGHRDFPGVAKACPAFDVKAWLNDALLLKSA